MRRLHRKSSVFVLALCIPLFFVIGHSKGKTAVSPLLSVNDTTIVYYERSADDAVCGGKTTLGEFIKYTLPFEWPPESIVMQKVEGYEAIKAGAVAVRTFSISVYNT